MAALRSMQNDIRVVVVWNRTSRHMAGRGREVARDLSKHVFETCIVGV